MATINTPSGIEKPKSFWQKPEGVTGTIVLSGLIIGAGALLYKYLPVLIGLTSNLLYLSGMLIVLGAIIYMVLDPRMRTLIGYGYKSIMRWITGIFVTIDPIGILKNYVEDLENNLSKMSEQIGALKGQIRKLATNVAENNKEIDTQLRMAKVAQNQGLEPQMVLASRKAGRLQETNEKYNHLLSKMDILSKVLTKMYENSAVLLEDTKDQVKLKEQERKAIRASHGAMKSAMNVITGNADQRMIFDQALEHIADSVDLQNGVFEEEGLKMLQSYEEKSKLLLMGNEKGEKMKLDAPMPQREKLMNENENKYDGLFNS